MWRRRSATAAGRRGIETAECERVGTSRADSRFVIPAKAESIRAQSCAEIVWIPAFAGDDERTVALRARVTGDAAVSFRSVASLRDSRLYFPALIRTTLPTAMMRQRGNTMHWMLMPLKRYADFSGRSRRMEYWMFQLFNFLVYLAMIVLMVVAGGGAMMAIGAGGDPGAIFAAGGVIMIFFGLYMLYLLAIIIPSLAVTVRRLHDTNRSGKWLLALVGAYAVTFVGTIMAASSPDDPGVGGIISLVGGIVALGLALTLLVFMFLEGTRGPNNYGPDPKGEALDKVFA